MSVAGAFLPVAALAIERSSNVYWLRRDRGELWFEARGFEADPARSAAWSRMATAAAWICSAGDAIAMLEGDAVTAFTAVAARPLFAAPGLAGALAVACAAVVDPIRHRVFVATAGAVIAIDAAGSATVAPLAARALALSNDRRRLYAATPSAITCITLDDGSVEEVAAVPAGVLVTALVSSPAGLAGTAAIATTAPAASAGAATAGGAALIGVNIRYGTCHVLRPLPAELAGAPVVADHAGTLTLAAPGRLYRCGLDGTDLAVCFTPG